MIDISEYLLQLGMVQILLYVKLLSLLFKKLFYCCLMWSPASSVCGVVAETRQIHTDY